MYSYMKKQRMIFLAIIGAAIIVTFIGLAAEAGYLSLIFPPKDKSDNEVSTNCNENVDIPLNDSAIDTNLNEQSDGNINTDITFQPLPPTPFPTSLPKGEETASWGNEHLPLSEELVIEFGTGDHYYIRINNGVVVGGYAKGSSTWDVVGGAYDGRNLQIVIVTDRGPDCKQWFSHNFLVDSNQVILRSTVDKCGNVIADRNIIYERLGIPE